MGLRTVSRIHKLPDIIKNYLESEYVELRTAMVLPKFFVRDHTDIRQLFAIGQINKRFLNTHTHFSVLVNNFGSVDSLD